MSLEPKSGVIAAAVAVICLCGIAVPLALAHPMSATTAPAAEAGFVAENARAMDTMMAAMDAPPTGDVERDFVEMMVPHHQGGIDMAVAYLRYGTNEQLRRLAQEIVVTQQQEIAAMRLALGDPLPPSTPSPTTPAAVPHPHHQD